ncbi:hypothetical protein ASD15_00130 [Massilia sp. Root351]|jgi:hypothetical protein|uniref:hypothetical protein n=1 Tax=Massilia sp. Root351 TaxID=1736522 RepID=UPI00070B92EA|nr:hypothetical protein [Massilia sp. Root351]KQV90540.1 hypothetical protein ASD15_00130 [Massilia sp. Root351]
MSLIFFALIKICGIALPQLSSEEERAVRVLSEMKVPHPLAPKGDAALTGSSTLSWPGETVEDASRTQAALAWLTKLSPAWQSNLAHLPGSPLWLAVAS